jgi:hypothetical protein
MAQRPQRHNPEFRGRKALRPNHLRPPADRTHHAGNR